MIFKFTPISIAIFIACVINVFVTYSSWRRRKTKGGIYFAFAMQAITFWTLMAGLDYAAVPIPLKIFFAKLESLGYMSAIALFAAFTLSYAGYEDVLKKTWMNLLLIGIPVTNLLLTWTNDLHGLVWSGFKMNPQVDNVLIFEHGPAFIWIAVSGYLLLFIIFISLAQASSKGTNLARKQARLLLLGLLTLIVSNLIYLFDTIQIPGVDWSSITFSVTGIIFLYALYGSRFMDVAPIARNMMIERMSDGVLVLDARGHLVDFNPTAQAIFAIQLEDLWTPFRITLAHWPEIITLLADPARPDPAEVTIQQQASFFDLRLTPLIDNRNEVYGTLLVIRDITRRKLTEDALQHANQRMENQLREISKLQTALHEQVNRDSLTQLYNRRFLVDALEREFMLAQRSSQPLSLVVIDIDNFKPINDTYGHLAGDECLVKLSQLMQQHFRKSDIVCRYGGEEFLIVMPNSSTELAVQRVEEFRQLIAWTIFQAGTYQINLTISAGVATYPMHGKDSIEIIRKADQALYISKQAGRNRVTPWSETVNADYLGLGLG